MENSSRKKVAIILVNYNSWKDTIICLEDLKKKKWFNIEIFIVDNCSSDNSVEKITSYLNGELNAFAYNNFPKWKKNKTEENEKGRIGIHFIKENENSGFAAGNNAGITMAYRIFTNENFYIWFLNNDTVVHEDSLKELITFFDKDNYGLIGSRILDFDPPHNVQSLYGSFNKYSGGIRIEKKFGRPISYPIGASLFTHSKIIDEVGFLDEDYFLYFEELDYSTRIRNQGYKIGIADSSIVYHQQGASTKSKKGQRKTNLKIEFYKYSGLKKFYTKNHPTLKIAYIYNLSVRAAKMAIKGQIKHSLIILKAMIN